MFRLKYKCKFNFIIYSNLYDFCKTEDFFENNNNIVPHWLPWTRNHWDISWNILFCVPHTQSKIQIFMGVNFYVHFNTNLFIMHIYSKLHELQHIWFASVLSSTEVTARAMQKKKEVPQVRAMGPFALSKHYSDILMALDTSLFCWLCCLLCSLTVLCTPRHPAFQFFLRRLAGLEPPDAN